MGSCLRNDEALRIGRQFSSAALLREACCTSFAVSACLSYSIPRHCVETDVWARASGATRRSTTLCNANDDADDDNMVAVVSCDAVLHFYISVVCVSIRSSLLYVRPIQVQFVSWLISINANM